MLYGILFLAGGFCYVFLELIWRGRSHVSMAIAGGVSLVLLFGVLRWLPHVTLLLRAMIGSAVITAVEFIAGAIVNVRMGLHVWDYSGVKGNILGQICPLYTVLWCLVCAPVSYFQQKIEEGKIKFTKKALP